MSIKKMLWVSCVLCLVVGCGELAVQPEDKPQVADKSDELVDLVDEASDVTEMNDHEMKDQTMQPCVSWENEARQAITLLDAGQAHLDERTTHTVSMVNCGRTPLTLRWPKTKDPRQFWIDTPGTPRSFDRDTYTVTLGPGKRQVLTLVVSLNNEPARVDDAILVYDEQDQLYTLPITIEGLGCPTDASLIEGRVLNTVGVGGMFAHPVCAHAVESVEFRFRHGLDADYFNRFEWRLSATPQGSTSRFSPSNRVSQPRVFLDVDGEYVIDVTAFSRTGACQMTGRIHVNTLACASP